MNFKKYLVIILSFLSLTILAQNGYDELPINQKISIKEGNSPFPTYGLKQSGDMPTPQTTGPE